MPREVVKVLPHPRFKGDWLVECPQLLPNALWYKSREDAIYHARLLGQDCSGEIRVIGREGANELVIPPSSSGSIATNAET